MYIIQSQARVKLQIYSNTITRQIISKNHEKCASIQIFPLLKS